jgi:endogenous inhibitor of DNA gyrase (YacG/DUF329 family)
MTEYILSAACPHCGEIADLVEETESPVALDREIPITTRWCPECGDQVGIGQWDLHEEHEIARVTPSQELPRFRTDKGNNRVIINNTAIFVLDEGGERMAVDHTSHLDGYVAFKEKGDTESLVKSNGEQATLHFTEV